MEGNDIKNVLIFSLIIIVIIQFGLIFQSSKSNNYKAEGKNENCLTGNKHHLEKRNIFQIERTCPPGCRRIVTKRPQQQFPPEQRSHSYFADPLRSGRTWEYSTGQLGLTNGPTGQRSNSIGKHGLQGPHGSQGVQGPQGIQGPHGPQGVQGPHGSQGVQGPHGPQGVQGPHGPQGVQGPHGPQGVQGPHGPQGVQGPHGPQGVQGPHGPHGAQGAMGEPGGRGAQGEAGELGSRGGQGSRGIPGTAGANGAPGPRGERGRPGSPGHSYNEYGRGVGENNGFQDDSRLEVKELKVAQVQTLKLYNNPNCIDEPNHHKVMNQLKDKGSVSFMILVDLSQNVFCILHS